MGKLSRSALHRVNTMVPVKSSCMRARDQSMHHLGHPFDHALSELEHALGHPWKDGHQERHDSQNFGDERQGLLVDGGDGLEQTHHEPDGHGGHEDRGCQSGCLEHRVFEKIDGEFWIHKIGSRPVCELTQGALRIEESQNQAN